MLPACWASNSLPFATDTLLRCSPLDYFTFFQLPLPALSGLWFSSCDWFPLQIPPPHFWTPVALFFSPFDCPPAAPGEKKNERWGKVARSSDNTNPTASSSKAHTYLVLTAPPQHSLHTSETSPMNTWLLLFNNFLFSVLVSDGKSGFSFWKLTKISKKTFCQSFRLENIIHDLNLQHIKMILQQIFLFWLFSSFYLNTQRSNDNEGEDKD